MLLQHWLAVAVVQTPVVCPLGRQHLVPLQLVLQHSAAVAVVQTPVVCALGRQQRLVVVRP